MKVYEIISEDSKTTEGVADTVVKGTLGAAGKAANWASQAWQKRQAAKSVADAGKAAKAGKPAKDTAAVAKAGLDGAAHVKKTFGGKLLALINVLGIAYYVYDYWSTILPLEKDFEEFTESLKKKKEVSSSNRFHGMSYEQALSEAEGEREKALGKAVSGVMVSAGAGFIGKFVSSIGSFFSCFPIFGPLIGLPTRGVGFVIQWAGSKTSPAGAATFKAGLIYFLENTETGQSIMKSVIASIILGGIGAVAAAALDTVVKGLDEFLKWINESEWGKKLGLNLAVPAAAKTKIKADPEAEKDAENVVMIAGKPATTADGYLRADRGFWTDSWIKDEIERQIAQGKPNPLNGLKLNPKLQYPTNLFKDMGYVPN